jgi:hypothetical protein
MAYRIGIRVAGNMSNALSVLRLRYAPVVSVVLFLFVALMLSNSVFAVPAPGPHHSPPANHGGYGYRGTLSAGTAVVSVTVVVVGQVVMHETTVIPTVVTVNQYPPVATSYSGVAFYGSLFSAVAMFGAAGYLTYAPLGTGDAPIGGNEAPLGTGDVHAPVGGTEAPLGEGEAPLGEGGAPNVNAPLGTTDAIVKQKAAQAAANAVA